MVATGIERVQHIVVSKAIISSRRHKDHYFSWWRLTSTDRLDWRGGERGGWALLDLIYNCVDPGILPPPLSSSLPCPLPPILFVLLGGGRSFLLILSKPRSSANANGWKALSRNHVIEVSESKLITVTGGKWTTFRKMAEVRLRATSVSQK